MENPDSAGPCSAPVQSLTVEVDERPAAVVITVAGEVDMLTAPQLRTAVDDAIARLAGRVLVLDLARITFFGSPGLQVLAIAAGELRRDDAAPGLRVATGGAHAVLRPVQITGLDAVLRLYDTVDAALAG